MKLTSACVGCFAGLACNSRIEIITLLQKNGEMSVLQIAKCFKLSQPTVTHHLKYLQEIGLLSSRKEGAKVFYSTDQPCSKKDCNIFS